MGEIYSALIVGSSWDGNKREIHFWWLKGLVKSTSAIKIKNTSLLLIQFEVMECNKEPIL